MRSGERGQLLILVLALLGLGALLLIPALNIAATGLTGKQVRTGTLNQQYTRDAGAEFAMWQLIYGGASALLDQEGEEANYTVNLNGEVAQVKIRMKAELGSLNVPGAEDNRIRVTKTVECAKDGDGVFDDDCLALPNLTGMVARYTVYLEQVAPVEDPPVGLVAIYEEFPDKFDYRSGTVASPDGSFPEILSITPTNVGTQPNQIWKWDFSSSPVYFQQEEVKTFTFEADIENNTDRYCNDVFLKMEALPNERAGKTAFVLVGSTPPDGCKDGGTRVEKFVDTLVAPPNETTVFTYIINVESLDQNTLHIDSIKDVLPQAGFKYCSPSYPPDDPLLTCDPPKYKLVDTPFNPPPTGSDSFTDITGFTDMDDPVQTYDAVNDRWELFWDGPGGAGWGIDAAGGPEDTFIVRFQAQVTPTLSGSYYNEIFEDVNCSAPSKLIEERVTSQEEYCASYSWPTGGTIVPTYDVRAQVEGTTGQGNVDIDWSGGTGDAQLNSWHIN